MRKFLRNDSALPCSFSGNFPIIKTMYSEGISTLLVKVISSWQVIAVTVALVLYLRIVLYVSRSYHTPRAKKASSKKTKSKSEDVLPAPEETGGEASTNDELGLEEE